MRVESGAFAGRLYIEWCVIFRSVFVSSYNSSHFSPPSVPLPHSSFPFPSSHTLCPFLPCKVVKVQKKELEQKNLISRGKASKASTMDKAIKDEHNNVKKCKYVKKHFLTWGFNPQLRI